MNDENNMIEMLQIGIAALKKIMRSSENDLDKFADFCDTVVTEALRDIMEINISKN